MKKRTPQQQRRSRKPPKQRGRVSGRAPAESAAAGSVLHERALLTRSTLAWVGLAVALVANDAMRVFLYEPAGGIRTGHVIAGVAAIGLLVGAAYLLVKGTPAATHGQWVRTGWLWLGLTAAFQLVSFTIFGDRAWGDLPAAYDPRAGRFGAFVLLTALLAPIYWSRRLYRRESALLWFRP
jgi:uncharacterized membrane protein YjfL (UPF0719 family)